MNPPHRNLAVEIIIRLMASQSDGTTLLIGRSPEPESYLEICEMEPPRCTMARFGRNTTLMMNRRGFISSSLALGAGLTLPQSLWAQLGSLPSKLPDRSLYDANEDAYWRELRKQFLIPADEVYLNNGTVGSSPGPVLRAIFEGYEACEKLNESDPEDYPIWGYASWNQFRDSAGSLCGL